MLDFIKKVMLTGVGLTALTKEKIEELAKDLAEKSNLSESEGKKLIDDILNKSEQARQNLEGQIENGVNSVIKKMNLATHNEISELKEEIQNLKKMLEKTDS